MMLAMATQAWAQDRVTLLQCYDSAAVASPLAGEKELYAGMTLLRDRNLEAPGIRPLISVEHSTTSLMWLT